MVVNAILSLLLVYNSAYAVLVPIRMLSSTQHPQAKCMDGSQAGYYYQEAPSSNDQNKWIIYLNGGGECDTQSKCLLMDLIIYYYSLLIRCLPISNFQCAGQ